MTDQTPSPVTVRPAGLSRRTVLKTAAWSAPVIAVAVSAPAAAASANDVSRVEWLSSQIGGGLSAEGLLLDRDGVGVDEVQVTCTVLSGPLAPETDVAVSADGGYFTLPQYSTLVSGEATATVHVAVGGLSEIVTVTVLPEEG